jgi:hypothetical protein
MPEVKWPGRDADQSSVSVTFYRTYLDKSCMFVEEKGNALFQDHFPNVTNVAAAS